MLIFVGIGAVDEFADRNNDLSPGAIRSNLSISSVDMQK